MQNLLVLIFVPILIERDEAWLSILFGIATTKIKAKKMGLGFLLFSHQLIQQLLLQLKNFKKTFLNHVLNDFQKCYICKKSCLRTVKLQFLPFFFSYLIDS